MTDLDLDSIEARANAAMLSPTGQQYDAGVVLSTDVPALVAEVRSLRTHLAHAAEVEAALTSDLLAAHVEVEQLRVTRATDRNRGMTDLDLDLDAIEARANAATEGPWEAQQNTYRDGYVETYFITGAECSFHALRSESDAADAEFIAYARTDVPALVAEVRSLREANESLGSMLEWQAEVIIDTRDALRVGGCTEHVLTAEQAGALEAATRILSRERNADPSRYDLAVAERDEARAEVERLTADAGKRLSWAIFAVRDHDAYAQPFVLMRDTDVSGVSGTGIVADGVAFPDGTVALRWRGGNPTSVVFHDNGVESVEAIHGHGGATRLVWLAEDLETTAEVAATYDERDDWRRRYEALRDGVTGLHQYDYAAEDVPCSCGVLYPCPTAAVVARVEES